MAAGCPNLATALVQRAAATDLGLSSKDCGGANTITVGFWEKEEGEEVRANAKSLG